jgi:hypothetical protein
LTKYIDIICCTRRLDETVTPVSYHMHRHVILKTKCHPGPWRRNSCRSPDFSPIRSRTRWHVRFVTINAYRVYVYITRTSTHAHLHTRTNRETYTQIHSTELRRRSKKPLQLHHIRQPVSFNSIVYVYSVFVPFSFRPVCNFFSRFFSYT